MDIPTLLWFHLVYAIIAGMNPVTLICLLGKDECMNANANENAIEETYWILLRKEDEVL